MRQEAKLQTEADKPITVVGDPKMHKAQGRRAERRGRQSQCSSAKLEIHRSKVIGEGKSADTLESNL